MRIAPGACVAVTGGTGFIGRALVSKLLAAGYRVRLLSRASPLPAPSDCEVRLFDLADPDSADPEALVGCDALLHLGAHIPRRPDDIGEAETCFRVNAVGTLKLLQIAAEAGVRAVAHTGAGNAYAPGIACPTEDSPLFPSSHSPFYLTSKVSAEVFAEHWARENSVRLSCFRPGSVYGSGYSGLVARWVDDALQGKPLHIANGGAFGADFVTGEDVAVALTTWLGCDASGAINIGSGVRHTLLDVATCVVQATGDSLGLISVAPATSSSDHGFAALDIGRAVRLLDFSPTPLDAGVQRMVQGRRATLGGGSLA